ncbi:MAG: hypothetical protein U0794_17765 [Isosphaeraceae bacterium]
MTDGGRLSIWFFVGTLLTVYGVLILGAGLYALVRPPEHPVVLAHLHADVWWGGFLLIVGLVYLYAFTPRNWRHSG